MFELFDTNDFTPRWECGTWTAVHGWIHVISDSLIFAAYFAIPVALVFFILKRGDIPFTPIFWLFAVFIMACGTGHLVEASIFWQPWYRLSALIKAVTAIVSWATVISLLPILPKALALPGLASINNQLLEEISQRQAAEEQLRDQAELAERSFQDLEQFTAGLVVRETRVIELKEEVNALLKELGRSAMYLPDPQDNSDQSRPV
jgi:hypothetical protein